MPQGLQGHHRGHNPTSATPWHTDIWRATAKLRDHATGFTTPQAPGPGTPASGTPLCGVQQAVVTYSCCASGQHLTRVAAWATSEMERSRPSTLLDRAKVFAGRCSAEYGVACLSWLLRKVIPQREVCAQRLAQLLRARLAPLARQLPKHANVPAIPKTYLRPAVLAHA